ncbi:Ribosomal RNA small subunit methyltransferase B [compost metagenome]
MIEDQAKRLGLNNVRTISGDAVKLAEQYPSESFDRILLDAPCSGLGVIRRKPDLKWTKSPSDIEEISAIQNELLDAVCGLLKPGGMLVYSTCTIEKRENIEMVGQFLKRHPEFEVSPEVPDSWKELSEASTREPMGLQILPQDYHSDGFYIARLVKRTK